MLIQKSVGAVLKDMAKRYPNTDAYVYPEHQIRKSYKEFDEETDRLAKAFIGIGIEKGEHVAIWSDNKREWLLSQFATGKMGAVLVTVNTNYQEKELEYLLEQSDATTLILGEEFKGTSYIDIIQAVCPQLKTAEKGKVQSERLPRFKRVIVMSENQFPGIFTWSEFESFAKRCLIKN
jgi:fatty-acyl-CoA synthase